jgi:hypothetical protein
MNRFSFVGAATGRAYLAFLIGNFLFLGVAATAYAQAATCRTVEVAVYNDRIHVTCDPAGRTDAYSLIRYFAMPTADAARAERALLLLLMAHQNRKTVLIDANWSNGSGQAFGCQASDCVAINGLVVR